MKDILKPHPIEIYLGVILGDAAVSLFKESFYFYGRGTELSCPSIRQPPL